MEGVSLQPAFLGQPLQRAKPIFWEHEGNRAVRQGPWKAVLKFKGQWELYNVEEDRTEQRDLATSYPDKLRLLADTWETWAAASFVDPWEGNVRNDWGEELKSDPDAPQLQGKPFTVSATVQNPHPKGVVIAQGGKAFGYALYFVDGKPAFAYRNSGELTTLTAEQPVSGKAVLSASVDAEAIALAVNGKTVAKVKSPGLFAQQPAIGLSVGFDSVHPVGDYEVPNRFNGRVLEYRVSK